MEAMVLTMAVIIVILVIVTPLIFYTQDHKYQILDKDFDRTLENWKEYRDKTNKEKQTLWAEIEELKKENVKLKEQNVSRETSYNPSYGLPEVIDWIDLHQPTGEEIKRG